MRKSLRTYVLSCGDSHCVVVYDTSAWININWIIARTNVSTNGDGFKIVIDGIAVIRNTRKIIDGVVNDMIDCAIGMWIVCVADISFKTNSTVQNVVDSTVSISYHVVCSYCGSRVIDTSVSVCIGDSISVTDIRGGDIACI